MPRYLLFFALLFATAIPVSAQSSKAEFEISLPKKSISGSLYTTMLLLDSREDTVHMGSVQKGLLHTRADVVFEPSLQSQLSAVMRQLADSQAAGSDTLIFQLRQLSFSQKPGYMTNKSYCFIKANLYAEKGTQYIPLASLDTLLTFRNITTGTSELFFGTSKYITTVIAAHLHDQGKDVTSYSWNTIQAIDSLEKSVIPIYHTTTYTDGVYGTWEAFKKQQPEWTSPLIAEPKDGKIEDVDFLDKDSTVKYLDAKHVYAIVYKGQPYISGEDAYYQMEARNNNLFFTGKAKVWADFGEVFLARQLMGPLSFLYELDQKAKFEIKIDHTTGMFIRMRQVKEPAESK